MAENRSKVKKVNLSISKLRRENNKIQKLLKEETNVSKKNTLKGKKTLETGQLKRTVTFFPIKFVNFLSLIKKMKQKS